LLLEPARFAVFAGATLTFLGTLAPWATGTGKGSEPVSFSPITDPDGVLFVLLSIAMPVLVASRTAAESRTRTLQALPVALGLVALLNWLAALRAGTPATVDGGGVAWLHQPEPGPFIAGVGVSLLAIAGTWIGVREWQHNGTQPDPLDIVLTRRSVLNGLVQTGCAVAGFVVGLYASLAALGPRAILVMTLGGLGLAGAGMMLGERISARTSHAPAGSLTRRPRSRAWTDTAPRF
jgi:hypothetical protein